MFLRIVAGLLMLLALLWAVLYAVETAALKREQEQPWPFGIGSMNEAAARTRPKASPEAQRIANLVDALDLDEVEPGKYIAAQTAKHNDAIDPPPKEATVPGHEAQLAELVRVTLSEGERAVWNYDLFEVGDAAELLAAAALEHARKGEGAAAWDNLHAMWILTRSREQRLFLERRANAVARMLPAPVPPWTAELAAINPRRDAAAQIQDEAMSSVRWHPPARGPFLVIEWLFRPLRIHYDASQARHARLAAATMTSSPRCRIDTAALDAQSDGPLSPTVADIYRAARIEAELEATAKVLALKNERARLGRWPETLPDAGASRCASNHWIYEVAPDGSSMKLRMSWEVAPEPEAKLAPALQFAY
ncbi:MAG TPA: hypothetical protein VG323_21950 [Thermoanaerobaculia bacterium]|nr:hypothetical protein [Thermoanaerobaculia bacterium]